MSECISIWQNMQLAEGWVVSNELSKFKNWTMEGYELREYRCEPLRGEIRMVFVRIMPAPEVVEYVDLCTSDGIVITRIRVVPPMETDTDDKLTFTYTLLWNQYYSGIKGKLC